MRWSVRRGFVALLFGTLAALGAAGLTGTTGVAGAATGFGSQVAATQWTATNPPALPSGESYDDSVSCVSSSFCVATVLDEGGSVATAAVQVWNGATWTTAGIPVPAGATEVELISVSCTSAVFCVVVGTDGTSSSFLPFAVQWDGSSWSISPGVTAPSGATNAELTGVSCTGPTWCMATGIAADNMFDVTNAFALQWNGSGWVPSPSIVAPGGSDAELTSISCTAPTSCMAVGASAVGTAPLFVPHAQSSSGPGGAPAPFGFPMPGLHANAVPHAPPVDQLLAEQWNGSSWSNSPVPPPPGVTDPVFESVSCAGAGFCMATGGFEEASSTAFAEDWSGGTWSSTPIPASPTAGPASISAVNCISPTSCTAVGETALGTDPDSDGTYLAGSWNGEGWSLQAVGAPAGTEGAAWFGISCLTGGFCVTAGGLATATSTVASNARAPIGRTGYRLAAADGGIFSYGPAAPNLGAPFAGSMGGMHLNAPIVGTAIVPSGDGYYLVASDGGVFTFGSASFYGSAGGTHLNKPIVGMAATPNGRGYYLVASDGGVFTYGNAVFAGSTAGTALNQPIVGMAVTPAGGYYLVGADGGVFNYGGAPLLGSAGSLHLNKPVVGMGVAPGGYYLVASDGGIFTYSGGGARPLFFGSTGGTPLNAPIVGIGV
ncbi:MAG TPA: hypothetical protein VH012_09235 [Acidimicrobiales bacterium]|nr:hypothetical protein [Acidimicrobiales bacterium]